MLFTMFLVSCGDYEYVRFESAQPSGVKASQSFNKKMKGAYRNCSNSDDQIIISDRLILNLRKFKFKSHRNDLEFDSSITVNKNKDAELISLLTSKGYDIEIYGDTIKGSITNTDTIFQISDNQVLKKFKGNYFLNYRAGEKFWKVNSLNRNKDTLFIGQISPSDSLLHYDFVVKHEEFDDSTQKTTTDYALNPSKKEFKELMKSNSFDVWECYCK